MTHIYVVGYPKSGNTWLARMIAKATKIPVRPLDPSHLEVATDVNKEIERDGGLEEGGVFKVHEMPDDFDNRLTRDAGNHEAKLVYIYRDIEDVFISSFFYFERNVIDYERDAIKCYVENSIDFTRMFDLEWWAKRIYWRTRLNRYLSSFLRHGYSKGTVTYANHLSAWFTYVEKFGRKFAHAVTKYEHLIDDPVHELRRIVDRIGFHELDMGILEKTVKSERFSERKRYIEETTDALIFGKEFNDRFLRAGKAGDHKQFLTSDQVMRLRRGSAAVRYPTGESGT